MTCRIIFLDIDGVLNHSHWHEESLNPLDPACIQKLNRLIHQTGARIVISSTWRRSWKAGLMNLPQTLEDRGFQGEIIGFTPILDIDRGLEIRAWFRAHPEIQVESFVILDDDDFDIRDHFPKHLVKTDPDWGISDQDVQRATKILLE